MYLTAFAAAAAAFLITALGGKPLICLLEKYRLTALLIREKDGVKTPDKKPVPEMGGLLYLCGLLGGGIIGAILLLITGGGEAFSASVSFGKLGAVLICTLLMGLLGLLDDWRRARSLPPMYPLINAHIGKKNLFPKEKRKQVLFVLDGSFRCGKVGRKF